MIFEKLPHQAYYLVELTVLLAGFFIVYLLSYNPNIQRIILASVLIGYALIGIFHHKLHHTLRTKIVVEYFLISVLIFAFYLFLSI
jgi:hypothetical protein